MRPESRQKRISYSLPDLCKGSFHLDHRMKSDGGFFADYLLNVIKILGLSPTGAALLRHACHHETAVGLDVLLEPSSSFFYAAHNRIDLGYQPDILQKTEKGLSRYLVSLIAGLRRAWHDHHGFYMTPDIRPMTYIDYIRVLEADVEAITHLVAWELRTAGTGFFWRHLLSSKNADIAGEFERLAQEDPQHVFSGGALIAAFDRWYEDQDRIDRADRSALEMIDLAVISGMMTRSCFAAATMQDGLQVAGILPTGRNYLAGALFKARQGVIPLAAHNAAYLQALEKEIFQVTEKQR